MSDKKIKFDELIKSAEKNEKKYYAVTTSMTFEKTVLVPADSVKNIDEAMDLVDCGVETAFVDLLNEEADFETKPSPYADENGIYELSADEAASYQILEGELGGEKH